MMKKGFDVVSRPFLVIVSKLPAFLIRGIKMLWIILLS